MKYRAGLILLVSGLLLVTSAGCLSIGSPNDVRITVLEETQWFYSSKIKFQAMNTGYFPVKNVEVVISYYKGDHNPNLHELITSKTIQLGTIDPGKVVTQEVTTQLYNVPLDEPMYYGIRVKGASFFK